MYKNLFVTLALSMAAAPALAADKVEIKDATINGSGCPVGTATIIVTNSTPNGPVDYVQMTFDDFIVENPTAGRVKLHKKFCKLRMDVKVPAGYTLGAIDFQNSGYTDRGEKNTKMALETTVNASALNSSNPSQRYPFTLVSSSSIEGDYDYRFPISSIGDTSASDCDSDRLVTLEIDYDLYLKTSRRSVAGATATVDQASLLIKSTESCQSSAPSNPWWWWGW